MGKEYLSISEKIELRRRGKNDAYNGAFQDALTGEKYPRDRSGRSVYSYTVDPATLGLPKPEYVPPTGGASHRSGTAVASGKPFVMSTFIESEIADFRDARDNMLNHIKMRVRSVDGGYYKGSFVDVCAEFKNEILSCSKEIDVMSKNYEVIKKMLERERDTRKKGLTHTEHIDALYEGKIREISQMFAVELGELIKKLEDLNNERRKVYERMKEMINSGFTHCINRITYYYDRAQYYDPRLPVVFPSKAELIDFFAIDILGDITKEIQEIQKLLNSLQQKYDKIIQSI